jgi:chromosome segregation ATPase
MGVSLADAKVLEDIAREEVERKTAARNSARKSLENARKALQEAHEARAAALKEIEELREQLKATQQAIMPSENASRIAGVTLNSTQKELAKAREERIAAEAMLALMKKEKEQAERLLNGAQEELEKSDEIETSSKEHLDEKLQSATDAREAMDAAMHAIDDARMEVERCRIALLKARSSYSSLPRNEDSLTHAAEDKLREIDEAQKGVETAQDELVSLHSHQEEVEMLAQEAREAYDRVQRDLHLAEDAKERAQANLRLAIQLPGLDRNEREQLERAQAEFDAAVTHCEELKEQNKIALTAYADADVEVIRFRLANEEATRRLEEAQAKLNDTEKEHNSLCDAAKESASAIQQSSEEVAKLEDRLRSAEERLAQLEHEGRAATENNATAQQGLKEMQEIALRYGRQSRNAANILDGRRHKLSDIVSAIEVGITQLESLRRREEECAIRLNKAYAANQEAYDALNKSKVFIYSAQKNIGGKAAEVAATEKRIAELETAVTAGEVSLSRASHDLDIAMSSYTEAQVAVIMAEIG